jgi:hypothetical protein
MTVSSPRPLVTGNVWWLIPLAALVLCAGCTATPGQIRLEPAGGNTIFVQDFTHSYVTQDSRGDSQIVLVSDPLGDATPAALSDSRWPQDGAGEPIQPLHAQSLRQVMHIHVLWQPPTGVALDNPSATNAAIDWYIVPEGSRRGHDLVHYQGAGFIQLHRSGGHVSLSISNASIKPAEVRGDIRDPIGPATLSGTAYARRDPQRVREILEDVQAMQGPPAQARAQGSAAPRAPAAAPVTVQPSKSGG